MRFNIQQIVTEVFCFLFIVLFAYTGMSKVIDHSNFRDQLTFVTGHQLIGTILSAAVPASELIIALLLCFRRTKVLGLYLFSFVMLCFTAYIVYLMMSDRKLPCTCGGVISSMTWKQHLIFNICFLVGSIATILLMTTWMYKRSPAIHR